MSDPTTEQASRASQLLGQAGTVAQEVFNALQQEITRDHRHRQKTNTAPALGLQPCPPGHLCEVCLDAPALGLQATPEWGEQGVCATCATGRDA